METRAQAFRSYWTTPPLSNVTLVAAGISVLGCRPRCALAVSRIWSLECGLTELIDAARRMYRRSTRRPERGKFVGTGPKQSGNHLAQSRATTPCASARNEPSCAVRASRICNCAVCGRAILWAVRVRVPQHSIPDKGIPMKTSCSSTCGSMSWLDAAPPDAHLNGTTWRWRMQV